MPRQRPSMPARGPSPIGSASGASLYTTHETRRSTYLGAQARVSNAEDCELSRYSRNGLSEILESDRHEQDSESSRRPSRMHPGILPPASDGNESDSEYVSRVGRPIPSQANLSDHGLNPRDSISNRGSSTSDNGQIPRKISPRGNSNTDHRYAEDMYCDPRHGAHIMTIRPDVQGSISRRRLRDQEDSSNTSTPYTSEGPRTPRNHSGNAMKSRHEDYTDDYEDPFAPRGSSGRSMTSYHKKRGQDDYEDPFTPQGSSGYRMISRYDDDEDDSFEDAAELRDGYRHNREGSDDHLPKRPRRQA